MMHHLAVRGSAVLVLAAIAYSAQPNAQTQSAAPATPSATFEVASVKMNTSTPLPPLNVVNRTIMRRQGSRARNGQYTLQGILPRDRPRGAAVPELSCVLG